MTLDQYLTALSEEPGPNAAPVPNLVLCEKSRQAQVAAPRYDLMTMECGEPETLEIEEETT